MKSIQPMTPTLRFLLQPVALTFALLVAVAAGEAVFLGSLVVHQRTFATVANTGGPQRMRTQRIAFLCELAVGPGLSAAERAELDTSIDEFRVAQHRLDADPTSRVGSSAASAQSALEREVGQFADAAAAVLARPREARAAHAYLLAHRLHLLESLDRAIEARKAREEADIRFLWYVVAGLVLSMALLVIASWVWIVYPLQRHIDLSREQLRALFEGNSDAVFTYDLKGLLLHANAAAHALIGERRLAPGRRFVSAIPRDLRERAQSAFAQAATGVLAELETTIVLPDGSALELAATLLPNIVDGRIVGVCAIARDVTEARRDARQSIEQSERVRDLYLVAASSIESQSEQIARALDLGCRRLGFPFGFIARLDGDRATLEASVGGAPFAVGECVVIEGASLAAWLERDDVLAFGGPEAPSWARDDSGRLAGFETFVVAPLRVGGKLYGGIGFAARKRRASLSAADRDFVRLIGALAGVAIERADTQRRLDALAFFDALTGLPNRSLLESRFAEAIAVARDGRGRFAVHFLDLDGFKEMNDARGHAVGDAILQAVALRLQGVIGSGDTVARFGGDEFVVVQRIGEPGDAAVLAKEMLAAIRAPIDVVGSGYASVGASIGIACFPHDGGDALALLGSADDALYRAKAAGRDRFEFAGREANVILQR